jgi:ABC-2 type transport system ATP-binding protein
MSSHQMATVEEFCDDITILNRSKTVLQGHLPTIKKAYGRVNLSLKTEGDITPYLPGSGVSIMYAKGFEYMLKVENERCANTLLTRLLADEIPVITFDLSEPTLHEIFIEKVGDVHEDL